MNAPETPDPLEDRLRASLARQVADAPVVPRLAERAAQAGRRRRRLTAAGSVAVLVAVGAAALSLGPRLPGVLDRSDTAAQVLEGPPRIPLVLVGTPSGTEVIDWPDGVKRVRTLEAQLILGRTTAWGILGVSTGDDPGLFLVRPDGSWPRVRLTGAIETHPAVSAGGDLATVVSVEGGTRRLIEVDLTSGNQVRSVPLGPPLVADDEPVQAVGYSGDRVVLSLGVGAGQRSALWEPGNDQVVGVLDGYAGAEGSAGEYAAFRVPDDDRCRVEIAQLRTGGSAWRLCREPFLGFSPDGHLVLGSDAVGEGLIIRDASDGDLRHTIDVPTGVRASGWESADTFLYATWDDDETLVVRCVATSGECATATTFPFTDRIPQPIPAP